MTPEASKIKRWREDPVYFATDQLKMQPDDWQVEGLRALGDQRDPAARRVGFKACKGPGKTALLAAAIWWFLSCFGGKGNHPKGVATSISGDNLKDNLWPELAKWQSRSDFLRRAFEWTNSRVQSRAHPETWFMSARAWPKSGDASQQANTLAGLHADYLLYVLDEAGGIPDAVMAAAEGGLSTGKFAKILMAGNPTHLEGPLFRACTTERHLWRIITITGDPDSPRRSKRISLTWAREQIDKYGRENPWVLVNVFGEFPPASINVLLGPDEVDAAMKRHLREADYNFSQRRIGVDVARFGDDRTVLFPRQGLASFQPIIMRNARTTDIAARVLAGKAKWGSEVEFVDDSGHWGHGVIDNLLTAGHSAIPVLFEDKATDPRYANKRTEMWFRLAEWVKRGAAMPNMPEMVRELTTPTYTYVGGRIQLEPKDQIKVRLGGMSPDLADALALTFAWPDMPTAMERPGIPAGAMSGRGAKALSEWDPFREEAAANG